MNRIIALGMTALMTAALSLAQGNPQRRNQTEPQQQTQQTQQTQHIERFSYGSHVWPAGAQNIRRQIKVQ